MRQMRTITAVAAALALLVACTACGFGKRSPNVSQTSGGRAVEPPRAAQNVPYQAEVFVEGLNVPWDLAFVPDGRLFVTERPGAIRIIEAGRLLPEPLIKMEQAGPFVSRGEGGLLGLAADPNFGKTGYLYVYHSYEMKGEMRNRVVRLAVKGNKAAVDKVVLDGLPGQRNHDGGRIRFGPDGMLYVTVGDAQDPQLSQDRRSLAGKILRIAPDGSIPKDNPFSGSPVYSWGHRNPQGLAWHPVTKKLYSSEHGQSAMDEINLIEPGANYGWPLIQGDETVSKTPPPEGAKLHPPLVHSGSATWAPSGMTFVSDGPWKGQLVVANLRGTELLKLTLNASDPAKPDKLETLYKNEWGRLRHVAEGPDGSLYVLTNNRDGRGDPKPGDDKIIRLKPLYQ